MLNRPPTKLLMLMLTKDSVTSLASLNNSSKSSNKTKKPPTSKKKKNKIRHERTVADLENEIATTKVELENVRLVLNQKRSELSHVNGVIQTSEPQLAQAKAALEAKIKECEQAEKDWNKLNAQRTEEKKLLKEVQEIMAELNDSNIRERTKEVITSL